VPGADDKVKVILVMPRVWDEPEFETVREGVEFFRQFFEVWDSGSVSSRDLVEFHSLSGLAIYTQTKCNPPI